MNIDVLFDDSYVGQETLSILNRDGLDKEIRRFISSSRPKDLRDETGFTQLFPYVLRREGLEILEKVKEQEKPWSVLARNVGELGFLSSVDYDGEILADASLYTFNSEAREVLKKFKIKEDTVPFELNLYEMRERGVSGSALVIYGRTPLMVSAQCTEKTLTGKCMKTPGGAASNLTDRMNVTFPVRRECDFCYNVIYNSVPLCLFSEFEEIEKLDPLAVRLDFTVETPSEAASIIKTAIALRNKENVDTDRVVPEYTKGHFRKGVD